MIEVLLYFLVVIDHICLGLKFCLKNMYLVVITTASMAAHIKIRLVSLSRRLALPPVLSTVFTYG